jgi:hypothetical protein
MEVLNALQPRPTPRDEVVEQLKPFWGVEAVDPDAVLVG